MFIGLLSDTHGVFSPQFRDFFAPVDQIWHAGDFGDLKTAQEIAAFKPLVGVHGNCDGQDIRLEHPAFRFFDCEGTKVLMTHIGGSPGHYYPEARELIRVYRPDVFVCGHSHILKIQMDQTWNCLYVNPGAAGIQGWHQVRTALRFHIERDGIKKMEVFELNRRQAIL